MARGRRRAAGSFFFSNDISSGFTSKDLPSTSTVAGEEVVAIFSSSLWGNALTREREASGPARRHLLATCGGGLRAARWTSTRGLPTKARPRAPALKTACHRPHSIGGRTAQRQYRCELRLCPQRWPEQDARGKKVVHRPPAHGWPTCALWLLAHTRRTGPARLSRPHDERALAT